MNGLLVALQVKFIFARYKSIYILFHYYYNNLWLVFSYFKAGYFLYSQMLGLFLVSI